jgi:hypothetical protein
MIHMGVFGVKFQPLKGFGNGFPAPSLQMFIGPELELGFD